KVTKRDSVGTLQDPLETTTPLIQSVEKFLASVRATDEPSSVLTTLLFTDIVGSTERVALLGDHRWRDLLAAHHGLVRYELARFGGREIDTAGDGFLASFGSPTNALRCAPPITDAGRALEIHE